MRAAMLAKQLEANPCVRCGNPHRCAGDICEDCGGFPPGGMAVVFGSCSGELEPGETWPCAICGEGVAVDGDVCEACALDVQLGGDLAVDEAGLQEQLAAAAERAAKAEQLCVQLCSHLEPFGPLDTFVDDADFVALWEICYGS